MFDLYFIFFVIFYVSALIRRCTASREGLGLSSKCCMYMFSLSHSVFPVICSISQAVLAQSGKMCSLIWISHEYIIQEPILRGYTRMQIVVSIISFFSNFSSQQFAVK